MMRVLRLWRDRRRHPQRYALLERILPVTRMPPGEVAARQREALRAIVEHAAAQTDFYARHLATGLVAFRRSGDAAVLPPLTRADLAANLDAMLARDAPRDQVRLGHTGGSTGQPTAFYYDQAKHELMLAGMLRGFMMSGWRPGQRVLYLWGAARDVRPGGVFGNAGEERLAVEKTLAAVEFSEERLAGWVAQMHRFRPVLLYGYASALTELARYMVDQGIAPPRGLLGVYSTAEMLHDWQRELIGRACACRVFNQYGCREVPNIAWECRHGRMHLFSDMVHLEALPDSDGPRLLVTSLTNRLMPFIRYDLGDSGRLLDGECDCGSPFPLMEMGVCRHNDLVRLADGRRIHPAYFNRLLYGRSDVRRYQWVQIDTRRLQLNLVATRPFDAATASDLQARLRADLDPAIDLQISYLDDIPRTPAGKHRFVIGCVDPPAHEAHAE